MECLRCGKKTEDRDVFCQECLDVMEKYPVKPGTVVQIPHRQESEPVRRKKERSAEEQLAEAEKKMETMRRWLVILTTAALLLGTLLYFSVSLSMKEKPEQPKSRNYTVIQAAE